MTEILSPESVEPISYVDVHDIAVLGGVVPGNEGLLGARVFLAVTILDPEGKPLTVNYSLSPWEAIRLGIAMGDVAVQTVETIKAADADPDIPVVPERKRDTSPYL